MVAFTPLLVALLTSGSAYAVFRINCNNGPLVVDRIDPIVLPGGHPANHLHTVHGGNHFGDNSTWDGLLTSTCSSCDTKQDHSNYWFPTLYFKDPVKSTFEEVTTGDFVVWYNDVGTGNPGWKAFPPGFSVISGDQTLRSKKFTDGEGSQGELAERALRWSCYRNSTSFESYTGYGFPYSDCEDGFKHTINFPSCWDGTNLDSKNHKTHMAFLSDLNSGTCPSTHPVYMMQIFLEVTWNIKEFSSRWDNSTGWPFVYSTGDPTGYSYHADFMNGWDQTEMQNAIDNCKSGSGPPSYQTGSGYSSTGYQTASGYSTSGYQTASKYSSGSGYLGSSNQGSGQGDSSSCTYLTIEASTDCTITQVQVEEIKGPLSKIPGCNPIQSGPEDSTLYSDKDCPYK